MGTEKKGNRPPHRRQRREAESNAVAGLAVIVLGVLSYFDLQNTAAELPSFIYYGLIGAALGAKWEAIADRLGGKR